MQILTAMNSMLRAAGEGNVDAVDGTHPLQRSLLDTLLDTSRLEQSRGWWFNEYVTTITPDADQHIILPESIVRVRSTANYGVVKRGQQLMWKADRSIVFDKPITLILTEEWEFEELPETFAAYVSALASVRAATDYNADQLRISALTNAAGVALRPMMKEHVDNARLNMLGTASMNNRLVTVRQERYTL